MLHEILIPHAIKAIKDRASFQCSQLTRVIFGKGVEEIGRAAFAECKLLHEILIPPFVKLIKNGAFSGCLQLTTAILNEGLDEIGDVAFRKCTSLMRF